MVFTTKFNDKPIYVSKALNYMVGLSEEDGFEVEEFTKPKEPEE